MDTKTELLPAVNQFPSQAGTTPKELIRKASDVASICRTIVEKTSVQIGKRKHVGIEGWQAIATAHGCMLSSVDVEELPTGWRAIGQVKRLDTIEVIAQAEGFVGKNEKEWAQREEFACRAMAQTRAMSRAGRSAFAHVVVMMNAGLDTTPAEEVTGADLKRDPIAEPQRKTSSQPATGDIKEKCQALLERVCDSDLEAMKAKLVELTTFTKSTDGQVYKGKESLDDCSTKMLQVLYGKLQKIVGE